jgi:large subunit ribosomal protein L25
MSNMQLIGEKREASGKGAARAIRRNGRIPAVLYGEGDPKSLSIDAKVWSGSFQHVSGNTIIDLKIEKDAHKVLVKDVQGDILTGRTRHIDFYAIHAGQKLTAMIPVVLEGTPHGVREGGILEHKIEALEVICLPKDLPEFFRVDISHLEVGDSIHVGELTIPDGVEVTTDSSQTLVVITHARVAVETVAEAETAAVPEEAVEND